MKTATQPQPADVAHAPAANFDCLARLYRWMEYFSFGPWLQRCRCAFLEELTPCRRALIFGDGDGRFTAQLLRANPDIEIDAVDSSAAMLSALCRRAGPDAARVHAYCADARDWLPANPPYDLVVTHFFLDCLCTGEIRALAADMRDAVSPSALWVVSEFALPPGWYGRLVAHPVVWTLYRAFGMLTGLAVRKLSDHAAALRSAGFSLKKRRTWLRGLLASEIWVVSPGPLPPKGQMLQIC